MLTVAIHDYPFVFAFYRSRDLEDGIGYPDTYYLRFVD
jgi:hypothetical protein